MRKKINYKLLALSLSIAIFGSAHADTYSLLDNPRPSMEGMNEEAEYGHKLISETFLYLGPEVADEKMRYAGNNYSCTNCHQEDATKPYAMPWTGLSKVKSQDDIMKSINQHFTTSMAGKPLPVDSKEMKGILAYIDYLSQSVPEGTTEVVGLGLNPIKLPTGAADLDEGEELYEDSCAICHGPQGQGVRIGVVGDAHGYTNPPIWGKDSFAKDSSFNNVDTLTRYIYNNMPTGADHESPIFDEGEARNIAEYILKQYNETR